jgi:hypothetical protein
LGGADHPAPPLGEQFVAKYVNRINASGEMAGETLGAVTT